MNRTILLVSLLFCVTATASAQSDTFQEYVKRQQQAQTAFIQSEQENFKKYRDSLNRQFAEYLEQEWKNFNLQKSEPPIKNPFRTPPVFDRNAPKPQPDKLPVVTPMPKPAPRQNPQPVPQPAPKLSPVPVKTPQPQDAYPLKCTFFGTGVGLKKLPALNGRLLGSSEKEVAAYWSVLAQASYTEWMDEVLRLRKELRLNDWGVYQLLNTLFSVYFPQESDNEQAVFTVFMLNQLGYRAKIGRNNNELIPLIAFQQAVHNTTYFTNDSERGVKYMVMNPKHKNLSAVQSCQIDYGGAKNSLDMSLAEMPVFSLNLQQKMLQGMPVQYNKNAVDFLATYPCMDFPVYAEAAVDETLWESIEEQVVPNIEGKSREEAVNWLLHFVQHAFPYQTDDEQFGYEKWFFAEETVASAFSDCEDRSFLFAQLVRRLLHMPVVLVHYPEIHLATAVKFSNPDMTGDYFPVDGDKYLICDPTYINADLGTGMPDLHDVPAEILRLTPYLE